MLKLPNSIFGNLIHYNEDKWVLNPTTKCGTIPSNAPKTQKKKKYNILCNIKHYNLSSWQAVSLHNKGNH